MQRVFEASYNSGIVYNDKFIEQIYERDSHRHHLPPMKGFMSSLKPTASSTILYRLFILLTVVL